MRVRRGSTIQSISAVRDSAFSRLRNALLVAVPHNSFSALFIPSPEPLAANCALADCILLDGGAAGSFADVRAQQAKELKRKLSHLVCLPSITSPGSTDLTSDFCALFKLPQHMSRDKSNPGPNMAHEWAVGLRAKRAFNDSESQQVIPVIEGVVAESVTPVNGARSIVTIFDSQIRSGHVSSPEKLWSVICSAIEHFADEAAAREAIIKLLKCLSEIDVLDGSGQPIHSDMNRDTFWRQLPGYSLAFREELTSTSS